MIAISCYQMISLLNDFKRILDLIKQSSRKFYWECRVLRSTKQKMFKLIKLRWAVYDFSQETARKLASLPVNDQFKRDDHEWNVTMDCGELNVTSFTEWNWGIAKCDLRFWNSSLRSSRWNCFREMLFNLRTSAALCIQCCNYRY